MQSYFTHDLFNNNNNNNNNNDNNERTRYGPFKQFNRLVVSQYTYAFILEKG